MNIIETVYDALKESTKEVQKVVEEKAQLEEKVRTGRYSVETVNREIRPRIDDLKQRILSMKEKTFADAKALVDGYRNEIDEQNNLDPKEINDDIKLLQAGIPLTVRDVEAILKRSENNRTMSQLAIRYAAQHDLKIENSYRFEREQNEAKAVADALDQALTYFPNWIATDKAFDMLDKFFGIE